jgi:hypothetical protein
MKLGRQIKMSGHDRAGQNRPRRDGEFPAQAQVVAWARGALARGSAVGRLCCWTESRFWLGRKKGEQKKGVAARCWADGCAGPCGSTVRARARAEMAIRTVNSVILFFLFLETILVHFFCMNLKSLLMLFSVHFCLMITCSKYSKVFKEFSGK